MIRFQEPWFALAALPVALLLWYSWRHFGGMTKGRKRIAFVVRALLCGIVVFALTGPEVRRESRGTGVMFVLDRSDSVSDADREKAAKFVDGAMRALGPDDVAGVVAFGRSAALEAVPGGRRPLTGFQAELDGSGSDVAGALRLAAASLPEGKGRRIVLLTDGHETTGDAILAVEALGAQGVQVDVVPLGGETRRTEVSVLELTTPSERRAAEPFEARVVVESTVAQDAVLVLERNGEVVARQSVRLSEGRNQIVVPQKLGDAGFYRYRATVEPSQDSDNRNNVGASFTAVRGKPRVLVLQGSTGHTALASALKAQGIEAVLKGPSGAPLNPEEIQAYDAVILNDFPAAAMDARQMALLRSAVRDSAVGFAMVGGEDSFLPGGWYGTTVAEILPVDLNVRQRKSFPSTTVLIVVDGSGSMAAMEGGLQKIQLAAKAAEETVNLLAPIDRVGVAGSTDGIEYVAPIQELKDKEAVKRNIRKLRPGMGGIYAAPSVRFAAKELEREQTKVRHLILLADGADVDDYGNSLAMIAEMRAKKITTSVVAIGDGKDVPFLKAVAAAGGGRFYLAKSASKLPAIFTQDVALMSRSAIEELTFVPSVRGADEIVRGMEGSFPALFAYCLTDARPLAKVSMVSPKGDPILATWQFGLGRSLAFTSDAQPRWASRWVEWDGFGQFWSQAARSLTRSTTQNDYQVAVRYENGKGRLEIEARDRLGNPLGTEGIEVRVSDPAGGTAEPTLTQEAPGTFSGSFDADELGSYIVTLSERAPDGQTRVNATGFSVPYPPEYRSFATNEALLNQIVEVSGGARLAEPGEALRPIPRPGDSIFELWPALAALAALLLPFDVAVRRLAVPWASVWARLRRRQASPAEPDARLATGRVREGAPDGPPAPAAPAPAPARAPRAGAAGAQRSAGSALLERRKRRGP